MAFLTLAKDGGINFGRYSDFWLGKPSEGDTSVTVYAIADAYNAVSAFKYEISQGDTCSIKVSQTIYPREELVGLGIGPMASVYLYGSATQKKFGNFYPEMHFSDGFILKADGNIVFQPLENYTKIIVSEISVKDLSYYGLIQRDRNYESYQTPFSAQHMMPNLWITPLKWGEGKVELIQMPTGTIDTLNIYTFWNPKDKLLPGKVYTFEYTMNWSMSEPPDLLGHAVDTRIGTSNNVTTFAIKFTGEDIQKLPAVTNLIPNVVINGNAKLAGIPQIIKDRYDNSWRVTIPVAQTNDQNKSNIITINCTVMNGKIPVTETWTYKWIQ
jgi:glucans biosynthesis protein